MLELVLTLKHVHVKCSIHQNNPQELDLTASMSFTECNDIIEKHHTITCILIFHVLFLIVILFNCSHIAVISVKK